jgi:hypothetical protein
MSLEWKTGSALAAAVNKKEIQAIDVVGAALRRIAALDQKTNSFTDVLAARAHETAAKVDKRIARSEHLPLAGVPFAVKNLFDVKTIPTRAGSKINRERKPASADSILIERLEENGAVLVGALNMGEYAHDWRLVERLRRFGRCGLRAACARLRHKRLNPRAGVVLRPVRFEADLWPLVAREIVSICRKPRSSRPACAFRNGSRAFL